MIPLTPVARLDVSAASGLVARGDELYVVADDECFLARYATDGTPRGHLRLFDEDLPAAHAERKRLKPDLEALTLLPDGRLLALGSGSTPARLRGALVDTTTLAVRHVDLAPLYARLLQDFTELNIEGAAVSGDRLWLAQRGNGQSGRDALIELDLSTVLESLARDARLAQGALCAIRNIALGAIDGVRLSMTDLAPHPTRGLLFCAAAEAGESTYFDGECVGAALGRLSVDGQIMSCERVDGRDKLEGISARAVHADGRVDVWLVADADDRGTLAPLLTATLPSLPA